MYYCLSIVLPFFMSLHHCIIVFLEVFFLRCVILLWNLLTWRKKIIKAEHLWDWSTVEEPHEFGCNFFWRIRTMAQQRPPPLTMNRRSYTAVRGHELVGRVCIVKWCRKEERKLRAGPRIATPNESTTEQRCGYLKASPSHEIDPPWSNLMNFLAVGVFWPG